DIPEYAISRVRDGGYVAMAALPDSSDLLRQLGGGGGSRPAAARGTADGRAAGCQALVSSSRPSNASRAVVMAGMFSAAQASSTSTGWRSVLPSDVIRYLTATGRVETTSRSTTPLRSSLRSVAVSDFCVT